MFKKITFGKFLFLFFFLLILASLEIKAEPQESIASPPEKNIFKVAILGDRTGGNAEGLKILERAVYEINQLDPDFVIHVGDKVQGYTWDQEEWLRETDEFKSYMGKLTMPWYSAAGNHDVTNPFRDPSDRTYEELYKKHFGPLYYSFDYKNSHFVIMYTDEAMKSVPIISDKQLQWLKSDLEGTNKNIFIFMHKPIWSFENSNWDKFHELIKKFPVRAVMAGHFHAYSKGINKDGIQYYILGPTGAESYTSGDPLTGYFHHYSILSVDGDKFSMAIVKVGNVESDDYILSEDYNNIWKIMQLSSEKTGITGWLWHPISTPISGKVELHVSNPLDKDIHVQVRLSEKKSTWQMVPKVLELDVPAKSNPVKAEITLSSRKARQEEIIPPELEFVYDYINSRNQHAPVVVKSRILLRDIANVHALYGNIKLDGFKNEPVWQRSSPLYNYTWVYSVYEKPDKPPKVYLTEDAKYLYFFAEVMDDKYAYIKPVKYNKGILSDAIVFSTMPKGNRQDIVIFPFNDEKMAYLAKDSKFIPSEMTAVQGVDYISRTDPKDGYYYCEGKISLPLLFGDEKLAGKDIPFNVGVIDNDHEAFIYLRSWAYDRDPKLWGIIK